MKKYELSKNHYKYGNLSKEYTVPQNTPKLQAEKEADIEKILEKIAKGTVRAKSYKDVDETNCEEKATEYLNNLQEDGVYPDLPITFENASEGLARLTYIVAELFHHHLHKKQLSDVPEKVKRGLILYMKAELDHEDKGPSRFHVACFRVPTCAVNVFVSLLPGMLAIEKEENTNELDNTLYTTLCQTMLQAWLLPLRGDETDDHVVTVPRFREHVWWEGGNALTFRPVYYVAICLRDVAMIDLLMYVSLNASQSRSCFTKPSFWAEGICADGWGWGHGNQTYNNGYPVASVNSIITFMSDAIGTAWEYMLPDFGFDNFLSLVRGLTWNINGNFFPPTMSRHCFYAPVPLNSKSSTTSVDSAQKIAKTLYDNFKPFMPKEMTEELKTLLASGIYSMGQYSKNYIGSKYFHNNDCLISKNTNRFYLLSMASNRLKGVECADFMADKRNFFLKDGAQYLQRTSNTYTDVMGTWNMTHLPGITTRHIEKDALMSEVNWSGYNSTHNFSAGVGIDDIGASGFIYEKDETRYLDGAGRIFPNYTKEMMGVLAHKSTFINGDTIVCLGANISDKKPEFGSDIITTVNNTLAENTKVYGEKSEFSGEFATKENLYIQNGGILYGLLSKGENTQIACVNERNTDWEYLNACNSAEQNTTVPVFELTINHGEKPTCAEYAYWAYCNTDKTPSEVENGFEIVRNDSTAQIVNFENGSIIEGIFFEKGCTENNGLSLCVSHPCALTIRKISSNAFEVLVTDALQDVNTNKITVAFKTTNMQSAVETTIELPQGEYLGAQACAKVEI